MSKETYIKGFCKVAEAHGVDPVQLAKFAAPAFETGGMAPDSVVSVGTNAVPAYIPASPSGESGFTSSDLIRGKSVALTTPYQIVNGAMMNQKTKETLDAIVNKVGDAPEWYKNWLAAHRVANDEAASAFANFVRSVRDGSADTDKALYTMASRPDATQVKLYHQIMNALTNGVPAQAAMPAANAAPARATVSAKK